MNKTIIAISVSSVLMLGMLSSAQASSASYGVHAATNDESYSYAQYGSPESSAHYGPPESSAYYGPPPASDLPPVTVTPGDAYVQPAEYYHNRDVVWLNMLPGGRLPLDAVVSGHQPQLPHTMYVCHARYHDGVHPGKLVGTRCNISWGGREIPLAHYEVLVSRIPLAWVSTNDGYIPRSAIPGGFEGDHTLFICQANYRGGVHAGKVVANNCNFGWGGREIVMPNYRVLTAVT